MKSSSSSSSSSKLSKEQLLKAALKKKECNGRAQAVVVSFIERNVNKEDLLKQLNYINQSHFDDIVDERYILQLCGYPLCKQELGNIPQKRYQISTATNKVYDITDRKKFCSSDCFKASTYLRSQLLDSPLWLRCPDDITEFKLLQIGNNKINDT